MNKNIQKIIITMVASIWAISSVVLYAQELSPSELNPRDASLAASYVFRLQYDQNRQMLAQVESLQYPYNIIIESFTPSGYTGGAPFSWSVISRHDAVLAQSNFEPSLLAQGPITNGKGLITIKAPYFANAKSVIFYYKKDKLFTISVLQSSFCNENKVCNSSIGESKYNCAIDCDPNYTPAPPITATSTPPTIRPIAPISPTTEPGQKPPTTTPQTNIWWVFITILIVVVVAFTIFFIVRSRKNQD